MDKLILIVDDDSRNLKLIRDLLQVSGYKTLEATDGKQGVALALDKRPDLILMDIQMPVMDGFEAARILKVNGDTKDIPVIALTAYAMKGNGIKIHKAGFDGYMTKPIDTRAFLKMVEESL